MTGRSARSCLGCERKRDPKKEKLENVWAENRPSFSVFKPRGGGEREFVDDRLGVEFN